MAKYEFGLCCVSDMIASPSACSNQAYLLAQFGMDPQTLSSSRSDTASLNLSAVRCNPSRLIGLGPYERGNIGPKGWFAQYDGVCAIGCSRPDFNFQEDARLGIKDLVSAD